MSAQIDILALEHTDTTMIAKRMFLVSLAHNWYTGTKLTGATFNHAALREMQIDTSQTMR
jgi:hypothetical protein